MSLNGLEVAEVNEAYQAALNEGGGWFLLKYNTRDEVGLLDRGKAGVTEIQEAVSDYEEESPLYGFIHYRRRKVVLKYVPEGTSRLLLARLAVHFESIKERFSPFDTIFTFAEAYELSDSTLSSTCSLHTAASIKSLRDSPTRNLAGVKEEDVSESGTVRGPRSDAGTIRNSKVEDDIKEEDRPSKAPSPRPDDDSALRPKMNGTSSPSETRERSSSSTIQGLRPRTASNTDKDLPPTPGFSSSYKPEKQGSIYDHGDFDPRSSIDTRLSSNSARPSTRDLNRAYDYSRPKVKIGPRPSMDSTTRPDTAKGGDHAYRPVASLPSGVRMPTRKAVPRPNSQQSQKKFSLQIPKIPSQGSTPAPPPVTPTNPIHPLDKRPSVPINGLQSPANTHADLKSPKMTPEKRRLMKALQIRQKHLAAQHAAKGLGSDAVQETQGFSKAEDVSPVPNSTKVPLAGALHESQSEETQGEEPQPEEIQPETRDLVRETSHDIQDSPVSAPEPSDGQSTQASSITEEEIPAIHKREEPESQALSSGIANTSDLQDIIREQTQGPVITVEDERSPRTSHDGETASSELDNARTKPEHPLLSTRNTFLPPTEANTSRNDDKTTSVASDPSSEHTLTDTQFIPPTEPVLHLHPTPAMNTEMESQRDTRMATTIPGDNNPSFRLPGTPKKTSEEPHIETSYEEPESPAQFEGHSVQTSASPSVVNLLDGLAATTHNESTLPGREDEVPAPAQVQEPSLFNMVGGFGDSEESIEMPLSAVREETETIPSPGETEIRTLHPMKPAQGTDVPQDSSVNSSVTEPIRTKGVAFATTTEEIPDGKEAPESPTIDESPKAKEGNQRPDIEEKPLEDEMSQSFKAEENEDRPQTPNSKDTSQIVEASPSGSPATQKTRPRTTSKTFQFPSKSRSLSRGDRPPSLDLPRNSEQIQQPWAIKLPQIPATPVANVTPEAKPDAQLEVQAKTRVEAETENQPTTRGEPISSVHSKVQPDAKSTATPVPEELAHMSSKALKLLGFTGSHLEAQSELRAEASSKVSPEALTEVPQETSPDTRPEAKPAAQPDVLSEVKREAPPEAKEETQSELPEGRSEGFLDVQSEVQPTSQNSISAADPFTSDRTNAMNDEHLQTDRQARRRGVVEPVKRVSTPEQSDEHFLSDDSFMEELKSATLQEAKPISVSRSPIKPGFLTSEGDTKVAEMRASRIVSSPMDFGNNGERSSSSSRRPAAVSLRSFSGTILPRPDVKTPPGPQSAQPKKFGVSSGISQRIKALEHKSSRPSSPNTPNLPTPTTPGFMNLRKPSFNSELNGALGRSRTSTAYPSPQTSPELGKSETLSRSSSTKPRGETVSVTATIIRDPTDRSPRAPRDAANPPILNLHESPLLVEHQFASPPQQQLMGPPQFSPLKPPRPRYSRYSSARSASSSSTEQKAEGTPASRRGSTASRRSGMSSRNGSEVDLPRALSDRSLNSSSPLDGIKEEKKGSRSSRLLKRMSSVTSISRRSIAQAINPSPKEGSIIEREEPIAEIPKSAAIDMGDINIQFPDTLLWKRRHMIINDGGILELSPSKADNNTRILTKRYPLSGFRPPYIPDLDRQELPNSIVLDFNDGSSLQCASENASSQAQLLNILKHAHSQHVSY